MSDFGAISNYISGGSIKRLSGVECDPGRSNQHELNGTVAMRDYLGVERRDYPATYIRLDDDEEKIASSVGSLSWYDAREAHPTRSEYRFYYQDNPAINMAEAGDLLAVILKKNGHILFISAPHDSQCELILAELFHSDIGQTFSVLQFSSVEEELTLAKRYLLEEIGIEITAAFGADYLEVIKEKFGGLVFPKTSDFSELARELSGGLASFSSPDEAVVACWDTEEAMFRQLEGRLIEDRLAQGFEGADDFLIFSQSIRQRRSSRAGHALENHLAALFDQNGIRYAREPRTENYKRPDFLFPSLESYKDSDYSTSKLLMLGVKTTCKDRWRQILTEADRLKEKHLFTLQPNISINQTDEMQHSGVQLVIPSPIHTTFTPGQQKWLWSLETFIRAARECQS